MAGPGRGWPSGADSSSVRACTRSSRRHTAAAPAHRLSASMASPIPGGPGSSCWPALERQLRRLRADAARSCRRPPARGSRYRRADSRRGGARDGRRGHWDRADRRQLARRVCRAATRRARSGGLRWWRSLPPAAGPATIGAGARRSNCTAAMHAGLKAAAPHADALVASAGGRRRMTQLITTNFEHIPRELLADQMRGAASCDALPFIEFGDALGFGPSTRRGSPARCGSCGAPKTSSCRGRPPPLRFRGDWLPHADWVELEGIGHCPQLDTPFETAHLILGAPQADLERGRRGDGQATGAGEI